MTDKEVIIDGVNVAGCGFYTEGLCDCCHTDYLRMPKEIIKIYCKENRKCFYKQLQREKQENKDLTFKCIFAEQEAKEHKNSAEERLEIINALNDDYKRLQAENEELKNSILKQCPNCGSEFLNPKGCELYEENHRYKQALETIGEVCNNGLYAGINYDIQTTINEVLKDE